jgi:hypothetical protein
MRAMKFLAHGLVVSSLIVVTIASSTSSAGSQASATASARVSVLDPTKADPARLLRDVTWLADDAREGRRAGTSKALECADFFQKRFTSLGLEAAGEQGFFQDFQVPLEARTGGRSSFAASAGEPRLVEAPADAKGGDLVPLFCSEGRAVTGPIVFCGFGIDDAERGRDDFHGAKLDGKIALVVRGVPKAPPKKIEKPEGEKAAPAASPHGPPTVTKDDGWGSGALIFTKVMNAKRRGAIGVILVQHPDDMEKPLLAFGEGGTARAGIPCAMVSWNGATRMFGADLAGWNGALEEGAAFAPSKSGDFVLNSDVVRVKGPARNVLAKLRGKDSSRTVVVGAHYDHLGLGGEGSLAPAERGQVHNGADDNASGDAAVLEIARLMSEGPRPDCDVLFVLWSGEELGLLGSEWWADHPTVPLENVAANLNLDMVGRADSGKLQVLAAGTAEPFASWMSDAGAKCGLELVVSTSGNMMGGSSDHATFLKRKIPALHLFSGLHSDYHKPSDDTVRFESAGAAKVTDLGVDLTRRLCAAGKLAFIAPKVDPNAKETGPRTFRSWFGSIPNYTWEKPGVLIDGTSPGSPAEHAGFLKGDVLLSIGDIKLDSVNDFVFALQTYKPGDVVLVRFERDGQKQETRVTLSTKGQQ